MYVMGNFSVGQYKDAGLNDDKSTSSSSLKSLPVCRGPKKHQRMRSSFLQKRKMSKTPRSSWLSLPQPKIQGDWNKAIGQLPPNSAAEVNTDDKFIVEGMETLSTAAGLAQFYDRDAPAAMAKAGMEGFQKFMLDPSTLDEVLTNLDKVQAEVYK